MIDEEHARRIPVIKATIAAIMADLYPVAMGMCWTEIGDTDGQRGEWLASFKLW